MERRPLPRFDLRNLPSPRKDRRKLDTQAIYKKEMILQQRMTAFAFLSKAISFLVTPRGTFMSKNIGFPEQPKWDRSLWNLKFLHLRETTSSPVLPCHFHMKVTPLTPSLRWTHAEACLGQQQLLFLIPKYCDDKYSLGNKLPDLLMTCHTSFGVTIILIIMIGLSKQSRMPFISGSEECRLS